MKVKASKVRPQNMLITVEIEIDINDIDYVSRDLNNVRWKPSEEILAEIVRAAKDDGKVKVE